jgi:hypothetical protein
VIALVLAAILATADAPTLDTVLGRAAAYVAEFERQLSGLVGEEHYVQDAQRYAKRNACAQWTVNCPGQLVNPMRTELESDLLLVRTAASGYVQYRDVFKVDGKPVRDREERLAALFADRSPASEARKQRILQENARYNIGDIIRTMNVPLLGLEFLRRENQSRFAFKRVTDAPIGTFTEETPSSTFRAKTEVWVIEYRERERGTLIRTFEGKDVPSRGRFWIEPETGRVVMTELVTEDRQVRGTVDVSFQSEPLVGLLVPVEMRERYEGRKAGSLIESVATYGRFRQLK